MKTISKKGIDLQIAGFAINKTGMTIGDSELYTVIILGEPDPVPSALPGYKEAMAAMANAITDDEMACIYLQWAYSVGI